jgi:hypothetical protein
MSFAFFSSNVWFNNAKYKQQQLRMNAWPADDIPFAFLK